MVKLAHLFLPIVIAFLLLVPAFAAYEEVPVIDLLDVPADLRSDLPFQFEYEVMPLTIPSTMSVYGDMLWSTDTTISTNSLSPRLLGSSPGTNLYMASGSSNYINPSVFSISTATVAFCGVGISANYPSGSTCNVSWSGFSVKYLNYNNGTTNLPTFTYAFQSSSSGSSLTSSYYIFDQNFNILAGPFSSSGSTSLTLPSGVTSLIFGTYIDYRYTIARGASGGYYGNRIYFNLSAPTISFSFSVPVTAEDLLSQTNKLLQANNGTMSHIDSDMHQVVSILGSIQSSTAQVSPMEQFEGDYLEKMGDQLSQIENMMSSENPALPNGGDIAGFASDVQNGLGVNGNSFDAAAFSEAASAFSGASATEAGGPWEFFTQAVADSLSGDSMTVGLADDDYIYAWLDEIQRRYGTWVLSSP